MQALGDPEIVAELESHLRDDIDRMTKSGHSAEGALQLAMQKIGSPSTLRREFAKVAKPWWPVWAVFAFTGIAVSFAFLLFGSFAFQGPGDLLLGVHVACITAGYLMTYGVGGLAICYALQRAFRELPLGQRSYWRRAMFGLAAGAFVLTISGMILGGIWANRHLGSFWTFDPREVGGLMTAIWQSFVLFIAWRLAWKTKLLMCVGLMGSTVVTYAWFVTNILGGDGLRAYGFNPTSIIMTFVIISGANLLIALGGLAPSGWLSRARA